MKRIVIWIASTVTVLVLLFGYHTSTDRATSTALPAVTAAPAGGASTGSAGSGSSSGSGSTGSSSGSGSSSSGSSTAKTYTGAEAQTRWGIVQVAITVKSGKITAVAVPEYPQGNPRDEEINSYALPTLVKETISAQNAKIDMVSGATVTSGGYLQSLQSALDQAGLG